VTLDGIVNTRAAAMGNQQSDRQYINGALKGEKA